MKKDENVKVESETKPVTKSDILENIKMQVDENLNEMDDKNMTIDEKFERTKVLYRSSSSTRFDLIFVIVSLILLGFIWVYIYKQPIPFAIKRILGLDSTIYQNDLK